MSFDTMRQHRRKIQIPLAIVVIIIFVFFFGAGGGRLRDLFSRTDEVPTEIALLRLGQDLDAADLLGPPRTKRYQAAAKREVASLNLDTEDERQKRVREIVLGRVERYYRERAAVLHRLPLEAAREFGVQVTDAELAERVREHAERFWDVKPFDPEDYKDALSERLLSVARFEELLRGRMMATRVNAMILMAAGASEGEQFGYYRRAREKVRVQYFQRRYADFVAEVEEASRREAAEAAKKKPPEAKAKAAPTGKGAAEDPKEAAEKEAPERKGVSAQDVKEAYQEAKKVIGEDYKNNDEKRYGQYLVNNFPEYFTEPKAKIVYLVALNKDFEREVKVTDREITQYYDNNKDRLYKIKPKPGTPPPATPKYRKLDRKLKREIRKVLIKDRAALAAAAAVGNALAEYNSQQPVSKRPKLRDLARKHKLHLRRAGPATIEELDEAEYLRDLVPGIHDLFSDYYRRSKKLDVNLTDRRRMADDSGSLTIRLVEFQKVRLLGYEAARAGVRQRLVLRKAGKLALEAVKKDIEDLEAGKLATARVRESVLLGADSPTGQQAVDRAVGEVSKPFRYSELLGPEAEAEEKRKEEEKRQKKKRSSRKTVAETLPVGWRAIILVERQLPEPEEFRGALRWRSVPSPGRRWERARLTLRDRVKEAG